MSILRSQTLAYPAIRAVQFVTTGIGLVCAASIHLFIRRLARDQRETELLFDRNPY